jgi:hypothetical protein
MNGCCSASGAKDCGSFLSATSIDSSHLTPSTISYEGIFAQHYFDAPPTDQIVNVSFTTASTRDPLSGTIDHFLCLSATSKYDGSGLRLLGGRPPVALVFVLDISGSMGEEFHTKSSKQLRSGVTVGNQSEKKTKLEAAVDALVGLLENLKESDYFGVVIFDTRAEVWDMKGEKAVGWDVK